jgi:TolA-binding protein
VKDCRGELLGRVRRGLASDQERTAFEAHLSSCESCRMLCDVMGDFDAVGEAQPGDSERVARMAAMAAGARRITPRLPLRGARRAWLLAAAALVLTGAAVASGVRWVAVRSLPQEGARQVPESTPPAPTPTREATVLERTPVPAVPPPAPVSAAPFTSVAHPPSPSPSPSLTSASSSASEAYRAANDARRAGRTDEAVRGYQQLQRRFPSSAEAHASRVSLGGLLLRNGSASAALAEFDAYLARGAGQLAAEALFGRGRALQTLGRSAEEANTWGRLVKQYPSSAYATHAQRRLDQLR